MPERLPARFVTSPHFNNIATLERRRVISDVPQIEEKVDRVFIVPAEEDAAGTVITPAIDLATGLTPNGRPIEEFYRGRVRGADPDDVADRALARATRMFFF